MSQKIQRPASDWSNAKSKQNKQTNNMQDVHSNNLFLRRSRFNARPHTDGPRLDYGLLSRGDNTLKDSSERRKQFFQEILKGKVFQHLPKDNVLIAGDSEPSTKSLGLHGPYGGFGGNAEIPAEVASTLKKIRALREALVAYPPDLFTKEVFLYSIRVAASARHYETYVPCTLYLLDKAHDLLSRDEEREIVRLLILHISHCNGDNYRALNFFFKYLQTEENANLYALLQAWITEDYYNWLLYFKETSDAGCRAILTFGLDKMVNHMVQSMNSAYFSYPIDAIEKLLPEVETWDSFKKRFSIVWPEDDGILTIRTRAKRTERTQMKD